MPRQVRTRAFLSRIVITTAAALAVAVAGVPSVGAEPPPTLDEVRERVGELHEKAAEANERHNVAVDELAAAERELDSAESRVERASEQVDELAAKVGGLAAATYRGGGFDPAVSALLSDDVSRYLSDASTLEALSSSRAELMGSLAAEQLSLEQAKLLAAEQERRLEKLEQTLREERDEVEELLAEQEELLERLTAEQRERMRQQQERERAAAAADRSEATSRIAGAQESSEGEPAAAPASGRAATAVEAALSKVGNSYVYGAAGSDVFDCSGLTSWAYNLAGVSLPRSSSAQSGVGTPVSSSELAPGDLLFYGNPVSHVAMYIGDGTVVHASNPRTGVTTAPAMQAGGSSKPFVGARRP